jgi:hypothetical protein
VRVRKIGGQLRYLADIDSQAFNDLGTLVLFALGKCRAA